jgi:hypothetical protein
MTGWRDQRARRPATPPGVRTRADWRELLTLASKCAEDVRQGDIGSDAVVRRAHLANRINAASGALFEREAGVATADVAQAFIRIAKAFARRETPTPLRQEMTAMVSDTATFLDQRLTQLAVDDFQRAHAGRPEVWG